MNDKIKEVVAFMKEKGVTIDELNAYHNEKLKRDFSMVVDAVYDLKGVVVTGRIDAGYLCVGMNLELQSEKTKILCTCAQVEKKRCLVDFATKGDYVAIKLKGVSKTDVKTGMILKSFF